MSERQDYTSARLTVVSLREAVQRHPRMYFGDLLPPDWPLIICAWTVHELLDYTVGTTRQVHLVLHREGALTAVANQARVAWPAVARTSAADAIVRHRMWWTQLGWSSTVTVDQVGQVPGPPHQIGDQLVWEGLRIVARIDLDADLFGIAADHLWDDAAARLRGTFATDRFRLPGDSQVSIVDEAAGSEVDPKYRDLLSEVIDRHARWVKAHPPAPWANSGGDVTDRDH